jgi:hypothetical protein
MKTNFSKNLLTLSLAFILSMFMQSCGGDKSSSTSTKSIGSEAKEEEAAAETPKQADIVISAPQLYKDYEANGVAADQKYKGKLVEVSGTVDNIDKDILDEIYVTLKGDEYFGSVQCYFADEFTDQTAKLTKGQKLTVIGTCDGKIMNVLMKDCSIK